jgi:hypothetical protein
LPAQKGAFIKLDAGLIGGLPDIVLFDFNPERLTRSVALAKPPPAEDGAGTKNALAQPGEPSDTISFSLLLDATDRLATGDELAALFGILPELAALELLQSPKQAAGAALLGGLSSAYASPPPKLAPLLFFWGESRIMPVVLTSLSVTETRFDQRLNPVRAEESVSLQVLPPGQIDPTDALSRGAYRYTQTQKSVLAALGSLGAAGTVGMAALRALRPGL